MERGDKECWVEGGWGWRGLIKGDSLLGRSGLDEGGSCLRVILNVFFFFSVEQNVAQTSSTTLMMATHLTLASSGRLVVVSCMYPPPHVRNYPQWAVPDRNLFCPVF